MNEPFIGWPKIPRLRRGCVITEKIDGTNALVYVTESGEVHAGSRNRWVTPEHDNYGFARWVQEHAEELRALGPGRHFGEWWGLGIQRRYDLTEKRFSLFNHGRWSDPKVRPGCCGVVPLLYAGPFTDDAVAQTLEALRTAGSSAALGFMRPEGIVVQHTASGQLFKVLLENDDVAKGAVA